MRVRAFVHLERDDVHRLPRLFRHWRDCPGSAPLRFLVAIMTGSGVGPKIGAARSAVQCPIRTWPQEAPGSNSP